MQYVARVETMPREPKYFPSANIDAIVLQVHRVVDNTLLGDTQCTLKIGRIGVETEQNWKRKPSGTKSQRHSKS